jgi:hypothetical protein
VSIARGRFAHAATLSPTSLNQQNFASVHRHTCFRIDASSRLGYPTFRYALSDNPSMFGNMHKEDVKAALRKKFGTIIVRVGGRYTSWISP